MAQVPALLRPDLFADPDGGVVPPGKFPTYYGWMTYIPLCLCVCMEIERRYRAMALGKRNFAGECGGRMIDSSTRKSETVGNGWASNRR